MARCTAATSSLAGRWGLLASAIAAAAVAADAAARPVAAIGPTPIRPPVQTPPRTNGSIWAGAVYRRMATSPAGCPKTLSFAGTLPTAYNATGTTFAINPADIKVDGVPCKGTQPDTVLLARFGKALADATQLLKNHATNIHSIQRQWPGAVYAVEEGGRVDCEPQVKWSGVRFPGMLFVEHMGIHEMEFKADVPGRYCFMDVRP